MSKTIGEKTSMDHQSSNSSLRSGPVKDTETRIPPTTDETSQQPDLEKAEEKKPSGGTDPASFPDGGLEAWLVVSGGFASLFSSFGWINAIGVFQTEWEKNQLRNYSPSTISWIPSLEGETFSNPDPSLDAF